MILTEPATPAVLVGEDFTYDVDAIDANHDVLVYELVTAPAGMTIDADTGEMAWTTGSGDLGSNDVTVRVTDGRGGVDEQSFSVDVQSASPGEIRGRVFDDPNENGIQDAGESGLDGWSVFLDQNQDGLWQIGERFATTDAAGDYVLGVLPAGQFTVAELRPAGWLQTAPAGGTHTVTLTAGESSTGHNFGNVQSTLTENQRPSIDNLPGQTVVAGDLWVFDVQASDPNGDILAYDLPVAPSGMTINADSGRAVWTPTLDQAGSHDVVLRVRDGNGGVDVLDFSIDVVIPNTAP